MYSHTMSSNPVRWRSAVSGGARQRSCEVYAYGMQALTFWMQGFGGMLQATTIGGGPGPCADAVAASSSLCGIG